MSIRSFKLRQSDKKRIWLSILMIFTTVIFVTILQFNKGFYVELIAFSGAIAWAPVMFSYLISVFIEDKSYDLNTIQRILSFILAGIFNIIIADYLLIPPSWDLFFLSYIFLVIPIQIVLILLVDLLLYLCRRTTS